MASNSKAARRIPPELWPNVRRELDQIDAVTRLEDLKVPPGNRLHGLRGDLKSIVNGRRAVSADTALLLQALTSWDAQIFAGSRGQSHRQHYQWETLYARVT